MSKEATWNFYRPTLTLRDDMLIDNNRFKMKDILMLEFELKHLPRVRAFEDVKKKGFNTTCIPKLKININKNIFSNLFFYLVIPFKVHFQLLLKQKSYLFYYIFLFHKECLPISLLMNLYDIGCNLSTIDCDDISKTIILNKYDSKNIIFHWSDLTFYKAYNHAFIAHNIYFVWGDIHYNYHSDNYFVDKKMNIGCIYKNEYNKAAKRTEEIINQIPPLKKDKKIVVFFDASFNKSIHLTEELFLEYLEIIKEFCKNNENINTLLKPRSYENYEVKISKDNLGRFKKLWNGLTSHENFIYLNPLRWNIEGIIAISDVCVNMGMNSPSTIALICGKNALYFDNTGNRYHPFAKKYKNILVFEDKELLFQQIDNILNRGFNCRDVISEQEIREYDAFADDRAMERLREHLYQLTLN